MPKGSGRPPHRHEAMPLRPKAAPELVGAFRDDTRAWWAEVWSSWWAGIYETQDIAALERLAVLVDKSNRARAGATTVEATRTGPVDVPVELSGAEHSAIDRLEAALGLTPRARQVLGWPRPATGTGNAAAEDEGGERADPATPSPSSAAKDRRRRLRAV